jgi:hypothetical protein
MSDPTRLKDTVEASGASNAARSLLRDASAVPAMTSEDRAAIVAAAMGAAGSTIAATGMGSAAAKGSIVTTKLFLTGLATVAVVGAVVGGLVLSRPAPPAPASTAAASTISPPPSAVASAPAAPVVSARADEPSPSAAVSSTAAASASARARSAPSVAAPAPAAVVSAVPSESAHARSTPADHEAEDTLAKESALIGAARANLESNSREAISQLEEHERRFPRGELAAERDFLMIKALRRLGRTDDARTRARGYAAKYPSSPYVPAVRMLRGELGTP